MTELNEERLESLWNMIYNISLGMLHNPADAEDASQEIFIRILENLPSFRGESRLETWTYRIARNHLLNFRQKRFREEISFDLFEQDITGFPAYKGELGLTPREEKIYAEEVKVGCTTAMLQCLDAESRFVFVLGTIFGFDSPAGAEICGITEEAYRQRLSRAGKKIRNFMTRNCGLINENAECRCRKRLKIAFDRGRIDPERLLYKTEDPKIRDCLREMNEIDAISRVYRDNPFVDRRDLFRKNLADRFAILRE